MKKSEPTGDDESSLGIPGDWTGSLLISANSTALKLNFFIVKKLIILKNKYKKKLKNRKINIENLIRI